MPDSSRKSMYAQMEPRVAVVHALTAYDRKMAKRRDHNRFFLGIALKALSDNCEESSDDILDFLEPFSGRLLGFLISELGLCDRAEVDRWGDLHRLPAV